LQFNQSKDLQLAKIFFSGPFAEKASEFVSSRKLHWDAVSGTLVRKLALRDTYRNRVHAAYRFAIPAGSRVLEVGCGTGDLLAALAPAYGLGVDCSPKMVQLARQRHPTLEFVEADVFDDQTLARCIGEPFDAIVLSDFLGDVWDANQVFESIKPFCGPDTRLVINSYSRVWEIPLKAAAALGLATRRLTQSWLTVNDISEMLVLSGFDVVSVKQEVVFPIPFPVIETIANRYLAKLAPFLFFAMTNVIVARHKPTVQMPLSVSVIVPARNEAGNIKQIIERVPQMGAGTELIFVEGHSSDDTYATIERELSQRNDPSVRLFRQSGKGKGDAVRLGFKEARGDILMILDADLTVPPETLPRFYEAIASGAGEFINGVRLVYPMEDQAMRPLNFLGNKFFSLAFSWLLGQSIKDTLCGTKVLKKSAYEKIARNRAYFGDFDPFGDFDLLFGAAKQQMKILGVPIRYHARTYGETNIERWKHGWLLLRMVVFAARRIKFV
jgi:ubiquinone/menaquinone biosynthesis C-methylase UbiE